MEYDPMKMDEDKYPLFETKWFNCSCGDVHHAIRMSRDRELGELFLEFRVNNYKSFWKRLRAAAKYLFNLDNRDASYDTMIVRKDEAQKMINILQKVFKENEYDEKLSACHQYGLCVSKDFEPNVLDQYICDNCEVCPRKSK